MASAADLRSPLCATVTRNSDSGRPSPVGSATSARACATSEAAPSTDWAQTASGAWVLSRMASAALAPQGVGRVWLGWRDGSKERQRLGAPGLLRRTVLGLPALAAGFLVGPRGVG